MKSVNSAWAGSPAHLTAAKTRTVLQRRRLGRWALRLGLASISLVIGLLVGEMIVRVVAPQRIRTAFAVDDPHLVYRNEPLITGRHTSPGEFDYRFSINSKGCRGRETTWEKPPRTRRMVCVGDSFTWGTGVEDDETYPAQLERLLNARRDAPGGLRDEVINAGVMSWGVSQYYIWARRVGLRYNPDVIVLGMFEDDWENALLGLITQDEAGGLVEHEVTFPQLQKQRLLLKWIPFFRQVMSHSQLMNRVQDALRARVTWPPATGRVFESNSKGELGKPVRLSEDSVELALRLTEKMVRELDRCCHTAGCRLVVMWIPRWHSVEAALDPAAAAGPEAEHLLRHAKVANVLEGFCRQHEILFMDATSALVRLSREQHRKPVSFFFERDGHFRVEGYAVLARVLDAHLSRSIERADTVGRSNE